MTADRTQPPPAADQRNRAFVILLAGSICWSLQPLMLDLSGSERSPLLFNIIHRFLLAFLLLIIVIILQQSWLSANVIGDKRLWRIIKNNLGFSNPPSNDLGCQKRQWDHRSFLFMVIGRFDLLLFAWAITYLKNTAIVAIIYGTSVLWFIFLRNRESPGEIRRFSRGQKILVLFIFMGVILVQASRTGNITLDKNSIGIIVAGVAAFLNSMTLERSIAWGKQLKQEYFVVAANSDRYEKTKEVICTLIGAGLVALIVACISLAGALIISAIPNNSFSFSIYSSLELLFIVIGSIVGAISIISIRWGNLLTIHSEVNLVRYIESPLSLILLFWLSSQQFKRLDLYITGTVIIIAANYIIRRGNLWRRASSKLSR